MIYIVRNSKGEAIAVATRKSDAEAMANSVGTEPKKTVDTYTG